ncbi:flagellar hook-associated protein FlgK [Desulfotruncus alcoholivorax]|uniref:flagellar hook-associated protein FlgK n=1 Tax=Desulfotruncus alcoholivorax TaxID=265477 RepID=UPI000418DD7C|nr:flagellar hook-associated protein FlgK [Desulfotruncus alcoholivorax]
MPSTFLGIETSRRGLQAHQKSLETTGHNIANANTPGYSRQQAVHVASAPYANPTLMSKLNPGQLGTGVEINEIRRIRNDYLDGQVRESISSLNYWSTQEEIYTRVEAIFAEPGSKGIGDTLTNFFRTWHDLNNNPQDPGVKSAVVEVGGELANMLNEAYMQLGLVGDSICKPDAGGNVSGGQMINDLANVKDIITQIQDVNKAIAKIRMQGNQPNDLLDKRDLLIDRLAEYGPVNVINNAPVAGSGSVENNENIKIEFFNFDLAQIDTESMTLKYRPGDNTATPPVADEVSLTINGLDVSLSGAPGRLAGLEKVRGSISNQVDGYREKLSDFAEALKKEINNLISPSTMFSGSLGDPNDKFRVNDDITGDPEAGTKAIDVARLYNAGIADLGNMTFNEYFNGLLSQIGAGSASTANMAENQTAINQQVNNLRESAAGVSLDEELSLLIQFQYGYQASARVMSTIDAMIDYLINRTG